MLVTTCQTAQYQNPLDHDPYLCPNLRHRNDNKLRMERA